MKTIMTGLDTEAPDLNKLVLAVVDKDQGTRVNEVNFKYLSESEKQALVDSVNAKRE